MKAIILAGGEGTRLRPLTYTTPKPLIPVGGRTLTEQVFDVLKKAGATEVILSVSYMADKIKDYFSSHPDPVLKINYLVEDKLMGTAGPLMILKKMGCVYDDDFIVVNGDNLFALDFKKFIAFHKAAGGAATIGLKAIDDVSTRGVVKMDGDKIIQFVEKPKPEEAPSNLISSGYYIFSPKIFDYVDANSDFLMLEREVFPKLAAAGKLFGFVGDGQWFDTGTPERYELVKKEWRGV